jgi:hypothetical protein
MSPYVANGQRTTYLPRGSAIQVYARDLYADPSDTTQAWIKLSEHNRSDIGIDIERIEQSQRMANGSLRKFFVADKKRFSVSWTMLPGTRVYTVDNQWGALDLIEFYNSSEGQSTFTIRLNFAKSGTSQESSGYEEYTVSCTGFNATLVKRGEVPFYNVSMSMEQV